MQIAFEAIFLNSVRDPLLTQPTHFVHGCYCMMSEVSCMLKETSKPSCCQVTKKECYALHHYVE